MFVNGAVLASVVAGPAGNSTPAAAPKPEVAAKAPRLSRKALVQRRVLLALVRSPSKLPRRFRDPATGLPRRNLRVACRQLRPGRYVCHLSVPGSSHRPRFYVRFRPGGGPLQFGREVVRTPV